MKFPRKFFKYLCHTVNLSHVIFGILLIVAGGLLKNGFPTFEGERYAQIINALPIVTIINGCVILLVACLGYYAVMKQNNSFVMIYANFLILLLVQQIAILIWMYVNRLNILGYIDDEVFASWWHYYDDDNYRLDFVQNKLKCCGMYEPNDYMIREREIPNSCCGFTTVECGKTESFYEIPGCLEKIQKFWEINLDILQLNFICNLAIEFVALILTWILYISNEIFKLHY